MKLAISPLGADNRFARRLLVDEYEFSCGEDAQILRLAAFDAREHYFIPEQTQRSDPERRFRQLAAAWKRDTASMSSMHEMVLHPAYQQIIGMGNEVLPAIIEELRISPDHWFWALSSITGADVVPIADRGDVSLMAAAWIRWGESNGYV